MKKRGDKRVQLKRLRFQIKQAFNSQEDLFHLLEILEKLEADPQVEKSHTILIIQFLWKSKSTLTIDK